MSRSMLATAACAAAVALFGAARSSVSAAAPATVAGADSRGEELQRHRNLGKAFYENPTTHQQAIAELRRALALAPGSAADRLNYGLALLRADREAEGIAELVAAQKRDPSIPHTWWNLGIAYMQSSRNEEARVQLEGMLARVPDDAATHYNLGVLAQIAGDAPRALRHLEAAARFAPDMAAPRYQLASAYRRAGRDDDAARELARFRELKREQGGSAVPEDPQWSRYSELFDPVGERGGLVPKAVPLAMTPGEPVTFDAPPGLHASGLVVIDAEGDGRPDLLAWSRGDLVLLARGSRRESQPALAAIPGVAGVVPGDFDNDGLADLCVLTATGPRLLRNERGIFGATTARLPAKPFAAAAWLDFDHDYDVDLLLLGEASALLRNNGDGTWTDATARFPFAAGLPLAATVLDAVADTQGEDVAVSYADHAGVLYRDQLGGRYVAEPLPALPAGARELAAADVDADGWTDVVGVAPNGKALVLANQGGEGHLRRGFRLAPAPAASEPIVFADLENRGVLDLVAADGVRSGAGRGAFATGATPLPRPRAAGTLGPTAPPLAFAAADFDGDGRVDLGVLGGDGYRLLANRTAGTGRWLRIDLRGKKNLRLAPGAEVEVKAGAGYQKQRYAGVPLHFGLARRELADTVRITWPNGLIQNETARRAGSATTFEEAPRLSGSCPMIFTWDGKGFRFITDVLGVAPLGASAGDGEYFPVDHDEYVQVPGEALVPVDGRYRVRVTEELREVSYLDEIHLLAVDHPVSVEVFTNDKFQGPPFPEFRLFGVRERIAPLRAVGPRGEDVRELLRARDGRYPTTFRHDAAGVAETHTLELDFGPAAAGAPADAVLVLSGWVDWADGSTFLGTAQRQGGGLLMPRLEALDERGEWRTVIADMGIPAGKPKTIVVDLAGKLPARTRRLRIVTNLCVYWDEIFLAEGASSPPVEVATLEPAAAELRFRGFSTPTIHPLRQEPERFDYAHVLASTMWNPTPGLYTRYGDVRELLAAIDDLLVVMGSGDEIDLSFDAAALPALPAGWRRDFLLLFDGWAKDADANTAFSQTVEPLPFHGMSQYPYPAEERFPDDPVHRRWREETLTRPALRLLRPLPIRY